MISMYFLKLHGNHGPSQKAYFFEKKEASKLVANQREVIILQRFSRRPIQSTNGEFVHSFSSKMEPKNSIRKLLLRYSLSSKALQFASSSRNPEIVECKFVSIPRNHLHICASFFKATSTYLYRHKLYARN